MTSNVRRTRAASLAMLVSLATLPLVSHAGDSSCDQARRDAYFEQQRSLTDGNTSPFMKTQTPAECRNDAMAVAKNDVSGSKEAKEPKEKTASQE